MSASPPPPADIADIGELLARITDSRSAAWLRQWQHDNRFTDARAAAALGLSERSLRRQKTGRSRVTRQTFLLAEYVSVHRRDWLHVAEVALTLARLTGSRP